MENDIAKKKVKNDYDFPDNIAKTSYQSQPRKNTKNVAKVLQKSFKRVKNQKIKWANNGNVRHIHKKKESIFENFY